MGKKLLILTILFSFAARAERVELAHKCFQGTGQYLLNLISGDECKQTAMQLRNLTKANDNFTITASCLLVGDRAIWEGSGCSGKLGWYLEASVTDNRDNRNDPYEASETTFQTLKSCKEKEKMFNDFSSEAVGINATCEVFSGRTSLRVSIQRH
ncbi:MAG TPA: hypothetical protein VNJ01_11065 [Bacteriovoracaceae bacterium]|nr:hypothetical protein [Bacteriovoracaceae bacterium]